MAQLRQKLNGMNGLPAKVNLKHQASAAYSKQSILHFLRLSSFTLMMRVKSVKYTMQHKMCQGNTNVVDMEKGTQKISSKLLVLKKKIE